mgnify:CR=1 FL=1
MPCIEAIHRIAVEVRTFRNGDLLCVAVVDTALKRFEELQVRHPCSAIRAIDIGLQKDITSGEA